MEFGIFHEFPSLADRPDADAFDAAFDLVDTAEQGGLDAIWLAELHFDPARSVLSAPLCVASAIAARTRRMRIGIAVQVLPLCHPLRLAEEAATVDQISRGRLILGVGRSGVAQTYEAYGVPYAESRDRFNETLDIVRQAWSRTGFSYSGTYHQFEHVTTTPRPYRQPLPDIRMAATSADTFPAIGKLGLPIFVGIRHEPLSAVAGNIALYREAYREAGHPGEPRVFLRFPAYLAATEARARAEAEPTLMHYYRAQAALLTESARRAGGPAGDRRLEQARELERITFEQALRGMVLIGTPDTVAERLLGLRDELGLAGVLMELNAGGLTPHAQVKEALRLLCAEVMPRFH